MLLFIIPTIKNIRVVSEVLHSKIVMKLSEKGEELFVRVIKESSESSLNWIPDAET